VRSLVIISKRGIESDGSRRPVTRLIQLLRSGDPAERDLAARLIWQRYFCDLLELARNNLNKRIRRREDEEDVLQSIEMLADSELR
jgi:ECF sigma factor